MISHRQMLDDLRGEFRGALHVDISTRNLYSTDASPFQILPHAVAVPVDEADLSALVRYAYEHNLPLTARGGGTGLSGESLGPGLIVDLAQSFRRVLEVRSESVFADAGFTPAEVNLALKESGRRLAVLPASGSTCTIGGLVSTNASGNNAFRYGYTRDYVRSLRMVWDDGEVSLVERPGVVPEHEPGPRLYELRTQTNGLLAANGPLIQLTRPQTPFNRCGYVLHDVMTPAGLDLPRLLAGSEGTLGLCTQAELATLPLPGGSAAAVVGFQVLSEAVRAGLLLRAADGIVSCDLLDQRLLSQVRGVEPESGIAVPREIAAVLILGVEGASSHEAEQCTQAALERMRRSQPLAVLFGPVSRAEDLAAVDRFRRAVVAGLYGLESASRPLPFIEDVAVPGEELVRYIISVAEILRRQGVPASFLIHVLTGQVHTRPLIDLSNPADRARLWPVAESVHSLAISIGGTVSSQHGTGITRTPWVEKQYGPLMPVFRELKRIFDPKGILNPGKIIGPDPSRPAWPLRGEGKPPFRDRQERDGERRFPLLIWPAGPEPEAARCNGCGDCRSRESGLRLCPVFRATGDERAAPRAKAVLFQRGDAGPEGWLENEVRAIADLCVNCKMCRSECRSHVNIPKLALEARGRHQAEHGLSLDQWLLARLGWLTAQAGNYSFLVNPLLRQPVVRWFLEKTLGLDRRRRLPSFTPRTFLRWAERRGLTERCHPQASRRVALFVDLYANTCDPGLALAAVRVLQHNAIPVHVPRRQRSSGMEAIVLGDLEFAEEIAETNVRLLADLVRDGYRIVCLEPTSAVALTQDYRDLLNTSDAVQVAENTIELTAFLRELHSQGRLRLDFTGRIPGVLGHHVPCHVKALECGAAGPDLLALIPGTRIQRIDRSCSGMAGTFGLLQAHQAISRAAGEPMLAAFRRNDIRWGSTECSACRLQIQQGSGKRTLHPVQYLAYAYGLMPELIVRLETPLDELCETL